MAKNNAGKPGLGRILFHNIAMFILTAFVIISIILIALLVIVTLAGLYAYNFVPIKTINLCISNETSELPINISCLSNEDCIKGFGEISAEAGINNTTGNDEIAEIGMDIMGNFAEAVSEETLRCVDRKCMMSGEENFDDVLGGEEKECAAGEESKEIKIMLSKLVPPEKLLYIIRKIATSENVRNTITGFIKTGKIAELEKAEA